MVHWKIKDNLNPYNPDIHKDLAIKALLSAGYNKAEISLWIEAIE
jgi:hypothetical protein